MLWLIGMMGSGKSTIGRFVSAALALPFMDTDEILRDRWGPIDEQFRADGEKVFRAREAAVVAEIAAGPPAVVATGGGAPLDPASGDEMQRSGVVIWLAVPADILETRLRGLGGRPLLSDAGAVRVLAEERESRYRSIADVVVDGSAPVGDVIREVVARWKR